MDLLITAAARALATGDPLGALKRVALRDDAPALALRGIAMAQLGDFVRAKALLRSAARAFGPKEAVARARCVVAEAEIALVSRDLGWPAKALDAARATLDAHGDRANAAHARNLELRRPVLIGRLAEAEQTLADLDPTPLPPALKVAHELIVAGIAMRRIQTKAARAALVRAERAARDAGIPGLTAEVETIPRATHAGSAADCAWRGAPAPARECRALAGVQNSGRGRLSVGGTRRAHRGLARNAPGAVRTRPRPGRGLARRRAEGHAHHAGVPGKVRR